MSKAIIVFAILSLTYSQDISRLSCIQELNRVERVNYIYPEVLESNHFILHYTVSEQDSQLVNGNWSCPNVSHSYAQSISDLLEFTLQIYLSQGWEMPPPDCDESIEDINSLNHCNHFGGNAKYDVYISNEGVGLVSPEKLYPVEPYTSGWTSYMHITSLQNQYEELPFWSHHVIAHELHHAIQMRYGSGTSGNPGNYTYNGWFLEQSATYMENVIFPNSSHLRTMLSNCNVVTPLTFPEHPIGYRFEIYPYRSALWQKFLVENYNDSAIVRYQWEEYGLQFASGQNVSLYPIYNNSILTATNQEFNVEKAIADYGIWRYLTGDRHITGQHFDEGNFYCTSSTFTTDEVTLIPSENGSAYFIELPNESTQIQIETSIGGILKAQYIKYDNDLYEIIDIDMFETSVQFNYSFIENFTHVLIITSGYSGNESQEIALNISLLEPIIIGDINDDSEVNVLDIVQLVNYILAGTPFTNEQMQIVDLNQDEAINILDVVLLVNLILDD